MISHGHYRKWIMSYDAGFCSYRINVLKEKKKNSCHVSSKPQTIHKAFILKYVIGTNFKKNKPNNYEPKRQAISKLNCSNELDRSKDTRTILRK